MARQPVMDRMAAYVRRCRELGVPAVMYVYGLEGLGVTSLVAQFGREHPELVGNPTIWTSGRRSDGTVVSPGELVARAFRQLAITGPDSSATDQEKIDTFHRVWQDRGTKDERFSLVVDDIANCAQIMSVMPVGIPGAVLIATSPFRQRRLDELGFAAFTLELLPDNAARTLFVAGLNETASDIEPSVIDELTDFCYGLPLLVKVLAAQINGLPYMAQHLLTRLQNSGLRSHELDAEKRIPQFLDDAYSNLDGSAQTTYRRLGSLPMEYIGLDAAAAVLDAVDGDAVYPRLEELAELSLLVRLDPRQPRYAFHPVVHDDARDRAMATDLPEIREQALLAWVTWYLRETLARAAVISDRWWVAPVVEMMTELHDGRVPRYSRAQALEWFDLEGDNVVAAVRAAHHAQLHHLVWPFCVALWKYLHLHGLHDAWIDIHVLGLASARSAVSPLGIMQMTSQLGALYLELHEFDAARALFIESLDLAEAHQHVLGTQSALEWLGKIAAAQGQFEVALTFYQRSWDVLANATDDQISPDERARAFGILWLQRARAELDAGNPDRSVAAAEHAVAAFEPRPTETDNKAKARLIRGRAQLALGNAQAAIESFETAFDLFDEEKVEKQMAVTNHLLGDAHRAAGDHPSATMHYRLALSFYERVGNSAASAMTASIAELTD